MSGQLCLKWNNHSSAFNKLLCSLHMKETYTDATIVCQGQYYPVHRFVLSTCSEYFEEIFLRCLKANNKLPFIIVKDIHPLQMEALLNYMYKGEVNVPQEMLPELIKAAEAFKIKGLAVPDEEPLPKYSKKRTHASSPMSQSKKSRKSDDRIKSSDSDINNSNRDIVDSEEGIPSSSKDTDSCSRNIYNVELAHSTPIKSEPIEVDPIVEITEPEKEENSVKPEEVSNFETFTEEYPPYNEDEPGASDLLDFDPPNWDNSQDFEGTEGLDGDASQRLLTDLAFPRVLDLSNQDIKRKCPFPNCNYKSSLLGNVKRHFLVHSKEKPYQCPHCPYRCNQKGNLQIHQFNSHIKIHILNNSNTIQFNTNSN